MNLHSRTKGKLVEAGYSRLMQIMSGLVPEVDQFGIITWENPRTKEVTPEENNRRNEKLKKLLKKGNYSYRQIKGHFETPEKPFFVHNISKKQLEKLGKLGQQSSVIHGKIKDLEGDKRGVVFSYIGLVPKEQDAQRFVWHSLDDDEPDYYSAFKGRKFMIPFFDDKYDGAEFDGGEIEFQDEHNVFYEIQLPFDKRDDVLQVVNELKETIWGTGMGAWGNRGLMYKSIKDAIRSKG